MAKPRRPRIELHRNAASDWVLQRVEPDGTRGTSYSLDWLHWNTPARLACRIVRDKNPDCTVALRTAVPADPAGPP